MTQRGEQLVCMVKAGGGLYQDAKSSQELQMALDKVQQKVIQDAKVVKVPTATPTTPPTLEPTSTTPPTPQPTATPVPARINLHQ